MPIQIPQGSTFRVVLDAYLSSDHITPATAKTIAVEISKNGAAYGNPNAGSTNATEIGDGSYYVDLDATDTNTLGPLKVLGTQGDIDPAKTPTYYVVPSLVNLNHTVPAIGRGTADSGASTTSIPTSAFAPAGAVADQFKGRVVLFDANTTTAGLRGAVAEITASSNAATPTFTVSTLPATPASGDTFSVI